jgi:hypothetical protein
VTAETTFERKLRERREQMAAEEAAAEAARIAAEEQRRALWGDVPVGLEDLFDPEKRGEDLDYVDRAQKYFMAAVDGLVDEVLNVTYGARNVTLNQCAFRLGQLSAGLDIPWQGAAELLGRASAKTKLPKHEIVKTLRSGITSGLKHPKGLPDGN